MFVSFDSLASAARVWVFQANRPFTAEEIKMADDKLHQFTQAWVVHGAPFDTSYSIRYNQFIILAADESRQNASGCSIDSSVRVLKEIETLSGTALFDRSQVAFWLGGKVVLVPLQELKQKFLNGTLNEEALTFNNLVNTKADLENNWIVPAGQTWLKRYIPNPLAKVR